MIDPALLAAAGDAPATSGPQFLATLAVGAAIGAGTVALLHELRADLRRHREAKARQRAAARLREHMRKPPVIIDARPDGTFTPPTDRPYIVRTREATVAQWLGCTCSGDLLGGLLHDRRCPVHGDTPRGAA